MRISTTLLDSYHLYRDEDWMGLNRIVSDIRGEGEVAEAMLRGRALHTLLENRDPSGECDGFRFDNFDTALAAAPRGGIDELKLTAMYAGHTVVGKVDKVLGLEVHEYKTTERFGLEKYADSIQWRVYLDLCRAKKCVYHVFPLRVIDVRHYQITDHHEIPVYAYPGMVRDIEALVRDFSAFVDSQGLGEHLPEKAA